MTQVVNLVDLQDPRGLCAADDAPASPQRAHSAGHSGWHHHAGLLLCRLTLTTTNP